MKKTSYSVHKHCDYLPIGFRQNVFLIPPNAKYYIWKPGAQMLLTPDGRGCLKKQQTDFDITVNNRPGMSIQHAILPWQKQWARFVDTNIKKLRGNLSASFYPWYVEHWASNWCWVMRCTGTMKFQNKRFPASASNIYNIKLQVLIFRSSSKS